MKKITNVLVAFICLFALSFSAVQAKNNELDGLKIDVDDGFIHELNGFNLVIIITNNTGKDVKITETDPITGPVKGFDIYFDNSYSLNGETVKDGEAVELVSLYFNEEYNATKLTWAKPTFKVEVDGKTYHITGERYGLQ